MDSFFERAQAFAEEAAKKSQELANQTAKYSQELAQETAKYSQELTKGNALQDFAKKSQELASASFKRSKELANEAATKLPELAQKAAQSTEAGFNQLVKELKGPTPEQLSAATGQLTLPGVNGAITEEELQKYGITEELREFVRGLTLDTFKEFPLPDEDLSNLKKSPSDNSETDSPVKQADPGGSGEGDKVVEGKETASTAPPAANVRRDLTDWQAHHALLVLQCVPEMSMFRYKLCPRFMKEQRFWRVYFLLVHSHVQPFEERAAKEAAEGVQARSAPEHEGAATSASQSSGFGFFSAAAASAAAAAAAAAAAFPSSISTLTISGTKPADADGATEPEQTGGAAASTATEVASASSASTSTPATKPGPAASKKEVEASGDADIDALLMDALGDDAAGDADDDDDGAFDAEEFDDLVNSALEDDDKDG